MSELIVTTSWDDGHVLDVRLAELLDQYGITGTFYIAPESREIAPCDRLTGNQVREIASRHEIGAHTITHPRLPKVDDESAKSEIVQSKYELEWTTGREIRCFCYPGGAYLRRHPEMVREAGFAYARTVRRFRHDIGAKPFEAPTTIHAYRHWSDATRIARVGGKRAANFLLAWDELAIELFDRTPDGGNFHLWGHSWEIDQHGDWDRLERVLAHVANSGRAIRYATNGDLI